MWFFSIITVNCDDENKERKVTPQEPKKTQLICKITKAGLKIPVEIISTHDHILLNVLYFDDKTQWKRSVDPYYYPLVSWLRLMEKVQKYRAHDQEKHPPHIRRK